MTASSLSQAGRKSGSVMLTQASHCARVSNEARQSLAERENTMLRVEIADAANRTLHDRLAANGYQRREDLDYLGRTRLDFGLWVEVWTKDDRKPETTFVDFGDLPELEVEWR